MDIELIKLEGIKRNLSSEISGRMHRIKNCCVNADKENFQNMVSELDNMNKLISEIKILHNEYIDVNFKMKSLEKNNK